MSIGAGIAVAAIWAAIAAMSFSVLSGYGVVMVCLFAVMATVSIVAAHD